ncbi:nucleoside-diphosphate-sugar epimerase [Coniochaeta sp. 2T2.1]|nr:nucleoside-diphosphate-sugar epimerase [Coniochaeta sp. 2T2.1]
MHLILTGATGLVGSGVLDAMVKMKDITKISIISRRPVQMADDIKDPRINVILHKDFSSYPQSLLEQVKDATGCVWALGISQNQVSKEEYIKITKDYTIAAAEAFQTLPLDPSLKDQPFHFVFVSGAGTTHQPGMFTSLFARVKGETELLLADMRKANPRFHADSVRPGFVDSKQHTAIQPYLHQGLLMGATVSLLGPPIRLAMKGQWSPTEPLGKFLAECAMGKWQAQFQGPGFDRIGEFTVVHNSGFRKLAGLDE